MKCECGCWWLAHRKKIQDGERKTICRNCDCDDFTPERAAVEAERDGGE